MTLIVRLLGPVQISRDNQPAQLRGYQSQALLAYLLLTGKAHTRQHLVDLLFDRADDPRANLRWILSELRRAIGGDYILADRHEVAFNFEGDYWLDVSAFEAGQVELYRGDFLEGLHLRDAFRFEDWLFFERERLRGRYQQALEQQLAMLEQQGDEAAVIETAHRLLRLDNLREDWQRVLIGAYASLGKREAALAQFEQCRNALQAELGIAPAAETVALAQAIQQGQIGPRPAEASPAKIDSAPPVMNLQVKQRLIFPAQRRSLPWRLLGVSGAVILVAGLVAALGGFLGGNGLAGVSREATRTLETTLAVGNTNPVSSAGNEAALPELAGTSVTILGAVQEEYVKLFERSMQSFEDRTGINVIYSSAGESFETLIAASVKRGDPPDIADFPQPGYMADFARQGKLVDVGTFLSDDYLHQQYPQAFLDLATVDGKMIGVWYEANLKSLVWYPKREFEAAGYKVPATWDELIALSDQMVADGKTPWCVGMEDGDASGWVGTDWIEDILLRIAPPETYDAWVRHELPFNSPEVRQAFEILGRIWFREGYVYGGPANIMAENWADSPTHLFENPPDCYLHRQGSWTPQHLFPKNVKFGQDYDFFYLPPIEAQFGYPVLVGGKILAMFNDRPEVREVMRYLTTVEAARSVVEAGGFVSPHRDVPLDWYPSAADLRYAQIILGADTFRFDGSDLMPGEVGAGSFWQGMVDWVNGADLETVLQDIDNSWPQ